MSAKKKDRTPVTPFAKLDTSSQSSTSSKKTLVTHIGHTQCGQCPNLLMSLFFDNQY